MFKYFYIFIGCYLAVSSSLFAQSKDYLEYYTLEPDSTVCVHLSPIFVDYSEVNNGQNRKRVPRKYRKGTRAYNRTIRNLKTVYPLAKKASRMIKDIERKLTHIKGEKARKNFIKTEYKKLMQIYKEPMKNMRISQGRMLIVLVHRETGNTSYEHIKNYKGGFTAFFWQGIARLFGNDLKKGYEPQGEHRYLEALIQQYKRGEL